MLYGAEQKNMLEMLLPEAGKYHGLLEAMADSFERHILPSAKKTDQDRIFPGGNLKKLTGQGIFALPFPKELNGRGLPFPVYVSALEMLATACANTALQVSVQGMICESIRLFGDDRQRDFFLREQGLVEGRSLAAFALTEPCCGSDAKAIQTTALASGDSYVLNGTKTMITNPEEADLVMVFAKTGKGISAFLVPANAPGFKVMKDMPKLGFRGNSLAAIQISNCAVDKGNLLGEEGKGLEYAKETLNSGRLTIAAIAVGIARAAYDKALAYSRKRKAFGESLSNFQLTQAKLADMVTGINAARLLTYYAAHLKERGKPFSSGASQAKLFSSETALMVCDQALQIHGGYGYIDGSDVHRHWRDARLLTIGEGTSDMLRLLIAHLALKEA